MRAGYSEGYAGLPLSHEFYGKTWIQWVRVLVFGFFAVFCGVFGPLYLTGVMKDANDEPRPQAGIPLTLMAVAFVPVTALGAYGVWARRRPVIRLCREGLELCLVGRTTLDDLPAVPGILRLVWAALSLEGFRTRHVRVPWESLVYVAVEGVVLARTLVIRWATSPAPAQQAPFGAPAALGEAFISESEVAPAQAVEAAIAAARDPAVRAALPNWAA